MHRVSDFARLNGFALVNGLARFDSLALFGSLALVGCLALFSREGRTSHIRKRSGVSEPPSSTKGSRDRTSCHHRIALGGFPICCGFTLPLKVWCCGEGSRANSRPPHMHWGTSHETPPCHSSDGHNKRSGCTASRKRHLDCWSSLPHNLQKSFTDLLKLHPVEQV